MPITPQMPGTAGAWLARLDDLWRHREHDRSNHPAVLGQVRAWLAGQPDAPLVMVAERVLSAYASWRSGLMVETLESLQPVLARPGAHDVWACRAMNIRIALGFEVGEMAQSMSLVEGQLALCRALGETEIEACTLHDIGVMHNDRGTQQGRPYLQQALESFRAAQNVGGQAFTHLNLAVAATQSGRPEDAREQLERAMQLAQRHGLPYVHSMALAQQGALDTATAPARAEARLREALRRQVQYGDRPMWEAVEPLARLLAAQGRLTDGLDLLHTFVADAQAAQLRGMVMQAHALLADLYEAQGAPTEALRHLRAHVQLMRTLRQDEHEQRVSALEVMHRTELMRAQAEAGQRRAEELGRLSHTDDLTGLPNRRHLLATGAALLREHPGAVAIIDIDHFKAVNDRHGHETGDRVLHAFATRLRQELPSAFVARSGGEEFVALFPGLSPHDACTLLDDVRMATTLADDLPRVTFTAGVAHCPDGDLKAALRRADLLLYQGKTGGRDCVISDGERTA